MKDLVVTHEQKLQFSLSAQNVASLLKSQCELHTDLYERTCQEYALLLESEIDSLDELVQEKQKIIRQIELAEKERLHVLENLKKTAPTLSFNKLGEMLTTLKACGLKTDAEAIEKLNMILLDIVDKIQEQNKRNQVFLNKAIVSLKDLKASFNKDNPKQFKTYNSLGASSSASTR